MKSKGTEPPSLFDNLDLFAQVPSSGDGKKDAKGGAEEKTEAPQPSVPPPRKETPPPPPRAAAAVTAVQGLTGHGPMRDLYDFNFRQYSAYVIC